jgi:putative NADH-flavin reductase
MKVFVLGARGGVGSYIVEEARSRGHEVTAGTRDLVDATDPNSVAAAAAGRDIVISAVINRSDPGMIVSAAQALLTGLEQAGTPRLVVVGGAGTLQVESGTRVADLEDFNPDYRAEALAHADVLELLRQAATPVSWTVVTPPRRFDDSGRTGSYRVGGDGLLLGDDGLSRISLEDFAVAIVDEVENPRHPRARFSVAY